MIDERRLISPLGVILAALLPLGAAGCDEALGPEHMPVTDVRGVVTEGGRPLTQGWIEFFPVEGTVGNLRSARLHKDGSFEASGVAVGFNLIRFVNADIRNPEARTRFGRFSSPIRRMIPAQPGKPLAIELLLEPVATEERRTHEASFRVPARGNAR